MEKQTKKQQKQKQQEKEKQEEGGGQKEELSCPECGSQNLIQNEKQAELVCDSCGLVVEQEQIDHGPDWRGFSTKETQQKSRVGAPMTKTMHDKGLTTHIDYKNQDAFGQSLSTSQKQLMDRLRKWQNRIRTKNSKERNLQFALGEINRMASSLDIPESTKEVATMIYRKALDKELLPGRSIEGVASSALYAACKQDKIPISQDEIADASRVDKRELARTYRYIERELGLKIAPVDPSEYIPKYASKLGLSEEVQQKATEIIQKTAEKGLLSGKSPKGYAAAAIYLASILCGEKKTQREIAKVSNISKVTIRNRYQEQAEAVDATI